MSFKPFFSFSSGFSGPLTAPQGTLHKIIGHTKRVESLLGYETEQYLDNPKHWKSTVPKAGVTDQLYCEIAEEHNMFVRDLHENFSRWWQKPPPDGEAITPDDARQFWHGLILIQVPPDRWTAEYYKARMDALYLTMRCGSAEGVSFDAKPLTTKQAGAVIRLFDQYLDDFDVRLEVPKGHDALYPSDDYAWCDKCGAIHWDDVPDEKKRCRKKGGCSLRRDYKD